MLRTYNSDTDFSDVTQSYNLLEVFTKHLKNSDDFLKIYEKSELIIDKDFKTFAHDCLKMIYKLKHEAKVKPGSKIAVIATNSYETMIAYASLILSNCTVIPINPSESSDYILKILKLSDAEFIIGPKDKKLINVQYISYAILLDHENCYTEPLADIPLSHPACMFFTSGTTGNPKGVVLSLGNLMINSVATIKEHGLQKDSIHFSCLPLCHVNAFSFSFFTNFILGSKFIYQSYFFPLTYWKIIKQENVEIVSSTPHIINLLNMDKREFDKKEFPHLKYFVSASAPLSKQDVLDFKERFNTRINQAYGLSETVNFTLTIPNHISDEEYKDVMLSFEIPSAGCPIYGNEVEILSDEGEILAAGETGEIVIRGWNVFQEYYKNPEQTQESFKGDFFHSGDTGYYKTINNRKYIFINGRKKEIVKRKGLLCYLAEIDLELKSFFGDISYSSCGFNNSFTGEEIGLVIENLKSVDLEKLKNRLAHFPPHKRPKVILEKPLITTSTKKPMRSKMSSYFDDFNDKRIKDNDFLINRI
jgi:acyl-CoA synthetase (AMP-forming)/AMP-acid ligase II